MQSGFPWHDGHAGVVGQAAPPTQLGEPCKVTQFTTSQLTAPTTVGQRPPAQLAIASEVGQAAAAQLGSHAIVGGHCVPAQLTPLH